MDTQSDKSGFNPWTKAEVIEDPKTSIPSEALVYFINPSTIAFSIALESLTVAII